MLKKISSYILVLAVGGALGTYFNGGHTIEERVVTKDRIKTVIKEIIKTNPDGTTIIERTTTKKEKSDKVASKKEVIPTKQDWGVGLKYDLFTPVPVYTIEVHRRVFHNLYVTGYGRTDGIVGTGLLYTF